MFGKKMKWVAVLGVAIVLGAAGLYTPNLPVIGPALQNEIAAVVPNGVVDQLSSRQLVPVDTQLPSGVSPQTVASTTFQIAALFAETANAATSTVHAATSNTKGGVVTTESLSTAAGAAYTFTLTDSLFTQSGPVPMVAMYSKTNTGGQIQFTSIDCTANAGVCVLVFTNTGSTAFNGTMSIVFHI